MKALSAFLASLMLAISCWAGQPVNVNTADAEQLAASLDGVGASKAQAIVAYREANGPFEHIDELVNVKGIGLATVDKNREFIRLDGDPQLASDSP